MHSRNAQAMSKGNAMNDAPMRHQQTSDDPPCPMADLPRRTDEKIFHIARPKILVVTTSTRLKCALTTLKAKPSTVRLATTSLGNQNTMEILLALS
jgi:hypothetical protein